MACPRFARTRGFATARVSFQGLGFLGHKMNSEGLMVHIDLRNDNSTGYMTLTIRVQIGLQKLGYWNP